MTQLIPVSPTPRGKAGSVALVVATAEAQWGAIARWQLLCCAFSSATIDRWVLEGRLHRVHRGVYALGHPRLPIEGRLVAALLYAGDGAALSHASGTYWWGLTETEPQIIDVSAPSAQASCPGVRMHRPRLLQAVHHRTLPVTTVPRTLVDYASCSSLRDVRSALAQADYRGLIDDPAKIDAVLRGGRRGSARLRKAWHEHQPEIARTDSQLERAFLELCERADLPRPAVGVRVAGWKVDAVWHDAKLVVELDGLSNHRTPAQLARDSRRDLAVRSAGFRVHRYTYAQITSEPALVAADVRRARGAN